MKLFDMTDAPNPRRVRAFLAEKGVDIDKVQIDIMGGENLESTYLAINPRGVLPTLQLDDGSIIDEASAICRYFEETHPHPALYGTDAKSKAQIESWVRQIEGDVFAPAADVLRNSHPVFENRSVPGTNNTPQVSALVDRGFGRVEAFYQRLNQRLAESAYIVGDHYSAADLTAMCAIDFASFVGIPVPEELKHLAEWHGRVSQRPSAAA